MSRPAPGTAPEPTVVVDVGNARMKWSRAEGLRLAAPSHAVHVDDLDRAVEALAADLPGRVGRLLVANVAGAAVAARLARLARERFRLEPEFVQTAAETLGVRCAYRDPSRLGVDRWVAIVAAHTLAAAGGSPRPACVIGAGTAMTFDAVDAAGLHLGGLILAGPRLAAEALQHGTRGIGATRPASRAPRGLDVLGKSTDEAVGHGALLGPAAAFDRAVGIVERRLGARPRVFLAGGDGPVLAPWLETEVELRADLVLEGLALIAAGGPAPASGPTAFE